MNIEVISKDIMQLEIEIAEEEKQRSQSLCDLYRSLQDGQVLKITDYKFAWDFIDRLRTIHRREDLPLPAHVEVNGVCYIWHGEDSSPSFTCDLCHTPTRGSLNAKYDHFRHYHSEYSFNRESLGRRQGKRFTCATCGQHLLGYPDLINHYQDCHKEALQTLAQKPGEKQAPGPG